MTEQETEMLLEAAAKSYGASHIRAGRAWGIEGRRYDGSGLLCSNGLYWNPLTDDGDALRLAGSLGLVVDCSRPSAGEPFKLHHFSQDGYQDIHAAIRRAIVRAAAEIGRNMK